MDTKIRGIPDDLHRAFRLLCVGQGVSMNAALIELIQCAVAEKNAALIEFIRRAVAENADLAPRKVGKR